MEQPLSFNATVADFNSKVIEASQQQLVLVDFWANWCNPCKMLMPRLELICEKYQGQFLLAKVESDQNRKLIQEYNIRNIPSVLFFKKGQEVDRFSGMKSDDDICALVDNQLDGPADEYLEQAHAAWQANKCELAKQLIAQAQATCETPRIIAESNQLLIDMGEYSLAAENLQQLPIKLEIDPLIVPLRARLSFVPYLDTQHSLQTLQQHLTEQSHNLELYLKIAAQQAINGDLEPAMENLLNIIKQDPKFSEGIARKQMLRIFEALNNSGDLVHKYRLQMAKHLL